MKKNHYNFENRTALVTGGAQGFGLDITKRFLDSGAKVVIWDIDDKVLDKTKKDVNNVNLISDIVDVSVYKDVEKAASKKLNNKDIYSLDKNGIYYYSGGWHLKAVYSLILGFIFAASTIWNSNLIFLQSYSWIMGAFIAAIVYYLLAKD